ncbi:DUF779 domain-containing protein [Streptomyces huasconensis]|uniref:DUF779 domain-containing protein n=1 Tax=Streptomyces huasconensis TaxID=1854574 RepID=A0ABV3M832_9ACTN
MDRHESQESHEGHEGHESHVGPDGLPRVELTPAAADLLRVLRGRHGPLMFHQSGGCCDGSAPMCYPDGEFRTGDSDVLLASLTVPGVAEPIPFWMSKIQYEAWRHTRLIVDVVPGRGGGFSLEAPEGVRFLIRSRVVGAWPPTPGELR